MASLWIWNGFQKSPLLCSHLSLISAMPCSAPVLDDFGRREGYFFSYNKKLGTARKYCLLFSPTLAKYWNVYYISFPASTTQHYNTKWQLQRRSQRPKTAYKPSFIFVQYLRGFKASFAIQKFTFCPRLDKCHRQSQIFPVAFRRFWHCRSFGII